MRNLIYLNNNTFQLIKGKKKPVKWCATTLQTEPYLTKYLVINPRTRNGVDGRS